MKTPILRAALILGLLATTLFSVMSAQSTLDKLRKRAEAALDKSQPSDDRVAAGLKEALTVGTGNAVTSTGHVDGFLKNAAIKILLPERLRGIGKGLRTVGMGQQVDSLEVGMNRAAEQAAPEAREIFINAVKQMTISDARQILSGGDTAATEYFKTKSSAQLTVAFAPIVHQSMENVGVVRQYNKLKQNPLATGFSQNKDFDLDQYVVGKTMDGLFYMIGEEEKKIRHDPAAQTTALLREIFGKKQ